MATFAFITVLLKGKNSIESLNYMEAVIKIKFWSRLHHSNNLIEVLTAISLLDEDINSCMIFFIFKRFFNSFYLVLLIQRVQNPRNC